VVTDRDQIMKALTAAKWVLGRPGGAAERLGLKRTTLLYRMRQLGITRPKIGRSGDPEIG
jgi:formate hydrogenlyase transcriptional activator